MQTLSDLFLGGPRRGTCSVSLLLALVIALGHFLFARCWPARRRLTLVGTLLLVALVWWVPASHALSFTRAVNYSVGSGTHNLVVGDFNGDGKSDLATANTDGNNVSVLLGTGRGTFSKAVNYPVGSAPTSVAVGDFNGDGESDLAVATLDDNNVSVLLGSGKGTFAKAIGYSVGSFPSSVVGGDFNGDRKSDLVTANVRGNNVSVLLGAGKGTFAKAVNYSAGLSPCSMIVGDFNGDGKSDLATANRGSATVSVLMGSGKGTFAKPVNYSVGSSPNCLAEGDFNGDGKSDLVTANSDNPGSNSVSVLLGSSKGTFARAVNYGVGSRPTSVVVGDFNGDGKSDLATANFDDSGSNSVSVLLGSGKGTFAKAVNCSASSFPYSMVVGDFNGDRKSDLATANLGNGSGNTVSVLLNSTTPFLRQ